MKNKKSVTSLIVIVMSILFLSSGYMAYAINGNSKTEAEIKQTDTKQADTPTSLKNIDNKKPLPAPEKSIGVPDTEDIDFKRPAEKEVNTSKIEIAEDISEKIKNSDRNNFDKNIGNYKKVLVQLNVPLEFREQLEKLIKKDIKIQDILPLYNFLYDNFGTIDELEGLVEKLESGINLGDIIREYDSTHPEFMPTNFENAYLENLLKTMSIDDIMIADRLSQKGLAKFADLIAQRQSGKTWKTINTELGVINTSDQLPRMSLTHAQVNKCIQDNGLNEKDATDVLILTWKTGKDYTTVTKDLKSGKKQEDISAEAYNEKYR